MLRPPTQNIVVGALGFSAPPESGEDASALETGIHIRRIEEKPELQLAKAHLQRDARVMRRKVN